MRVSNAKKDLRGLGMMPRAFSSGIFGNGGTVDRRLAAEVGKYIMSWMSLARVQAHGV